MADQQVLFVCTANICRSPAAEAIARHQFGESTFRFRSAGFLEHGRPMEPDMVKALNNIDIVTGDHRSSVIDAEMMDESSIIFTMESRHVQNIVIENEAAFAKVLPLKEANELVERHSVRNLDHMLALLDDRDPMRYLDRRWDVEDPYKRARRHYRRSAVEIADLVGRVVGSLRSPN